jgi:putative sterol carrier protein
MLGTSTEAFSPMVASVPRELSMVQYFTKGFFDEVADRLNSDTEWGKKSAAITAKIVLTCGDRSESFLLDIQGGKVAVLAVAPDVPADFKFEGNYDAWTQLGKGEKDFQGLVLGGKIRFRGSMPKVMALMGSLSRITQLAQQVPKEF